MALSAIAPDLINFATTTEARVLFNSSSVEKLCIIAEEHAQHPGELGHIKAYRSGVKPRDIEAYKAGDIAVAIDFGGTQVKGAALITTGDGRELKQLSAAAVDSQDAATTTNQHSIYSTAFKVAKALEINAADKSKVKAIFIAYSQPAETLKFSKNGTKGSSAIVPKDFKGGSNKGEGFMKSVKPGDDIGNICLQAFKDAGYKNIKILRCDNDTIATAAVPAPNNIAFKRADLPTKVGGVVASTGANYTIFVDEKNKTGSLSELANSEGGNEFKLPAGFLPDHIKSGFRAMGITEVGIERLVGRINLCRQFFWEVEKTLLKSIAPSIRGLSIEDKNKLFAHKDNPKLIEMIVKGERENIAPLLKTMGIKMQRELSVRELQLLQITANSIGKRSAQMCALMCYSSASNCLNKANYVANLDASMVGIFPDFAKNTQVFVDEFVASRGRVGQVYVNHMPPSGNLSIPIQGGLRIVLEQLQ